MGVLHDQGRARSAYFRVINAGLFKEPAGRAVTAGHARPHVLMKIDEYVQAEVSGAFADAREVIEVVAVIGPGPGVLDRFPGREQAHHVKAPSAQASEMFFSLIKGEGAPDKRNLPVTGKVRGQVSAPVRRGRDLAVAAKVHPAQEDRAAEIIRKPRAVKKE